MATVFTPWKDESALLAVRNEFYPPPGYNGPDHRSHACKIVALWKQKGTLPHPVEATALLTDAILHDDAERNSVFSIRATYSAAFCRFVTGLVDSKLHGQRKTMFARAMDLGLPASFVELRHEATHRELPSLVVLRKAASRSLDWLWGYYWGELSSSGATGIPPIKEMIRSSLKETTKGKHPASLNQLAARLGAACQSERGVYTLARVLIDEAILNTTEHTLDVALDLLLQKLTDNKPVFLSVLVEEMVNDLVFASSDNNNNNKVDPEDSRNDLYMWLDHILSSPEWESARRVLSRGYLDAACKNPGYWTDRLRRLNTRDPLVSLSLPDPANDLHMRVETGWDSLKDYGWCS
ncbi:hypothetical protein ASPZODRAFT_127016 [Penicilliopsis zonata CBS 506.65]|uniref:Pre-rRNA-processing protein las1 n=1 Tax=Penicilliopsis zonata CBS 506.65 TaxID=1073090 RepID=A0A1L9SUW9_9EURO|nr:hypothetical protein ASPZODRAFT_127016 [Penicilliopsis zonata CBS 506.65]OJJ51020.1 hypothetical protein ASPZODRAFT_127016 [Penicilliopsis zonata CBS 506.65]